MNTRTPRTLALAILLCLSASLPVTLPAQAQTTAPTSPRGVLAEDYLAYEFAGDPQLSPDGSLVAYVVTKIDRARNRRVSSIWLAATDGSRAPWQFTTSPQSSNSPRWSPDGKALAFLSSRDSGDAPAAGAAPAAGGEASRSQIFVLSMTGGEALRLTNLKNGISAFSWSPDGSRMVAISRSGASDSRKAGGEHSDVRHYRNMSYKFNDTGWFDDHRRHLWVVDAKSGSAKQITEGDDWNDSDPQWSPDGTRIAFVSNRTGHEYDDSRNTDVWTIAAEGGALTKISDHDESDDHPAWSPDGKTIAFLGRIHRRDQQKIYLAPANGGAASVSAMTTLDLAPATLKWTADGKALVFGAENKGEDQLFRLDLAAKSVAAATSGTRVVHSASYNFRSGKMAYLANDFRHPDDVYVANVDGSGERKISDLNAALWQQLQLADVERYSYKSADGWMVDGFIVKPIGWKPGVKYPTLLNVHGGPAGQYTVGWYQEFQVYAAQGYAVVFTNPRGSTGYGEKFERGISGEWGGKDYIDVMNGLDAAIKNYAWIDTEHLGVTGGSYGGFMTNWIVGHTNRFKAAVTLRSLSNFVSDEGTRDGAYGHETDFGGNVFDHFDFYWERSPLKYAKNVKTPTLILHSDNDFRVPIEQGEQWFRALQHFGVTSEIVMFPRENHNLTRTGEPKHLVESMQWQLYWFDRFIKSNASALPPDHD